MPQVSLPTGTPSAGGTAPAGSLSAYTTRLIASKPFQDFRDIAKSINKLFPKEIQEANAKLDEYARGMVTGGTLFEELGFYYMYAAHAALHTALHTALHLRGARLLLHVRRT